MENAQHDLSDQFLTFTVADQLFGVSVMQVNSVLKSQKITPTPLAPPAIAGLMNLRGRIVTAINVRRCLNKPENSDDDGGMNVVVEQNNEWFSLMIDQVGDVLTLEQSNIEAVPETLDSEWRSVSLGIHKLQDKILVILNVEELLQRSMSN